MKILVTGANGFLGRGIVDELKKTDNEIIATDFKFDSNSSDIIQIECNLFEIDNPFAYFNYPDVLLHLAWRDGFVHYSEKHINDLPKHYKFIKAMTESGIKQIAVMGSMHEVGFYEGSIDEDTPCNPVTPYGISKNALRSLTQILCQKNDVIFQWLRGFYIVSNSAWGSSVFSKIVQAEKNGDREFPFTKGLNQFDFIDYDIFCRFVTATICQNKESGIINICSGRPEKLADRVERFIKDNGYKIALNYGAFPDRPYDSKAVWGNDRKIKRIMKDM